VDNTQEEASSVYDDPELHMMFEEWSKLDANGDGVIKTDELRNKLLYHGWAQDDVDICLGDIDRDGDGVISFSEFVAVKMAALGKGTAITGPNSALSDEVIRKHFSLFDQNGDGEIGIHELGMCFAKMKLPLGDKAAQEYLAGVDLNSDGKLSFGEFSAFVRSVATLQEKKLELAMNELELDELNERILEMQAHQSEKDKRKKWRFFLENRRDQLEKEMDKKRIVLDGYVHGDGIGKHMREYMDSVREITDGSHAVSELFARMGLGDPLGVKLKLQKNGRSITECVNSDLTALGSKGGGSEAEMEEWILREMKGCHFLLGHPERDAHRYDTASSNKKKNKNKNDDQQNEAEAAQAMERKQMAVFLGYCYRRPHLGIPEASFSQLVNDLGIMGEFTKEGTGGGLAVCFARAMKKCSIRRTGESSFLPLQGFQHAVKEMLPLIVAKQRAQEMLRSGRAPGSTRQDNNMHHASVRRPSLITLSRALTVTADQQRADLEYTSKRMSGKIFGKWRKASTVGTAEAMKLLLSRAKSLVDEKDEQRMAEKLSTPRMAAKCKHPGLLWTLKVVWGHYLGDRKHGVGIGLNGFLDCLRDFGLLKASEVGTTIATKEFAKGVWRLSIAGTSKSCVAHTTNAATGSGTDLAREHTCEALGAGLVRHLPFAEFVAVLCRCAVRKEEREAARVAEDQSMVLMRRNKTLNLFANEATANGDAHDEDVKSLLVVNQYMQQQGEVDPFPAYGNGNQAKPTGASNTYRRGSYFGAFPKPKLEKMVAIHAQSQGQRQGNRGRLRKRPSPSHTSYVTKQARNRRTNQSRTTAQHAPSRPLAGTAGAARASAVRVGYSTDQLLSDVPLQVALPQLVPIVPMRPAGRAHRRTRKHGRSYRHLPDSTPWSQEVPITALPTIRL
jgi:Ca2+-binding EF-hand superfamily protein